MRAVLWAALGTLAIAIACSSKIPGQPEQNLCDGSQVHATRVDPNSCTVCLEDKCCDEVGDCSRNDVCKSAIVAAQKCVLDEGPNAGRASEEQKCVADLTTKEGADKTYACMRANCGLPCGLPVCKLAPGVPSLPTARCDDCFAQTCCREMNECSGDRRCLRMLECIITRCANDFPVLLTPSTLMAGQKLADLTCMLAAGTAPSGPPTTGQRPAGPSKCFDDCYDETIEFAPSVQGGQLDFDRARSACLANKAFVCGSKANCGADCVPAAVDSGVDAGEDAMDSAADASDASDAD